MLDPFCGCATACVAAEQLARKWIGIDISPSTEVITKIRLQEIVDAGASLFNPFDDVTVLTEPPIPTRKRVDEPQLDLPRAHVHKHELYGQQEGKCAGCNYYFPFRNMTIDHILAQAKSGTDHKDNLQLHKRHEHARGAHLNPESPRRFDRVTENTRFRTLALVYLGTDLEGESND